MGFSAGMDRSWFSASRGRSRNPSVRARRKVGNALRSEARQLGFFRFRCLLVAANNGQQPLLTPNQQKALHCLGQTVKAKELSIGLDVAGAIPGFGNLFSGAAAGIQGLNAAYYGTVSLANAGNTLLNPSASGAANTAATAGFAVASLAASGSKAIPVIGTIVSLGFLAYDVAGPGGAISTYQQCMAGPG